MAIPRPDDRWYFAYGSNLDIDQKSDRTGKIRCAIRACLHGFRFAFNKQGSNGNIYANIMPDQDGVVWGVAYLCCPEAINTMDEYEGVLGGHYEHETVTINKNDGIELAALTYVAGPEHICSHGRPKNAYLQKILNGARYHGLPTEYIDAIERAASNV